MISYSPNYLHWFAKTSSPDWHHYYQCPFLVCQFKKRKELRDPCLLRVMCSHEGSRAGGCLRLSRSVNEVMSNVGVVCRIHLARMLRNRCYILYHKFPNQAEKPMCDRKSIINILVQWTLLTSSFKNIGTNKVERGHVTLQAALPTIITLKYAREFLSISLMNDLDPLSLKF
jgi:hypothetical protein